MQKTKSAVRYGMETLKLSPDELFKLIESSKGYDGEDYNRWLASKIIELAEADGVQFSQLLVKKFNIINDILEEVSGEQVIRDEFLNIFKNSLTEKIYTVDVDGVGEPLEVDWYDGIDLDSENSFFVMEKLSEDIRSKILEDEKFSVLFRLSFEASVKKSDLCQDAKSRGIILSTKGAMLLYRLCNIVSAFNLTKVKFGIITPVKFLYDSDNVGIIDFLLDYFNIEVGYSMKSIEVSLNAINSGDIAFITLTPRLSEERQDGIVLTSITLDSNSLLGYKKMGIKRYSKANGFMLDKIEAESPNLVDTIPSISHNGEISYCKGVRDALGYLNINGDISLSTLPIKGKRVIAITKDNILDIIAYFGITVAREKDWGYSSDIPCLINGRVGYEELLYNCLPLFLFDYKVDFRNMGELELESGGLANFNNALDVLESEVVKELLDVGSPYFSFEAKELFNVCLDYIKYVKDNVGVTGKSFKELRENSDSADFNRLYENRLAVLKEYVDSLSKKFF